MGLHDRIATQKGLTGGPEPGSALEDAEPRHVDPYAELKTNIHNACIKQLGVELLKREGDEDLSERVLRAVTEQLALDRTPLTREERHRLVREIADDILGYGPIEPLLQDDSVTEVMVNASDRIYVERSGKIERVDIAFVDDAHLLRIIDKIVSQVGRRIDEASPMVDARLPDGSRVNAIIPPLSLKGPSLTIRKFSRDPYTMDDLISFGTLTPKTAQFLAACVRGKLNVLISGGTGTGKTTTLNAMSAYIPGDERIVTIEDAAELQLQQEHIVSLVRVQFLLHQNLYLVAKLSSLECPEPVQARVVMFAALASVPGGILPDLKNLSADVYRFDLTLADEDGTWRVVRAAWSPATARDLL